MCKNMGIKMVKYKLIGINLNKEEKWIEKYIEQGYHLASVNIYTGRFVFEPVTKETDKQTIRLDYRTFKKQADFEDYVAMFEDSGWHHLAGTKGCGVQVFEKVGSDTDDSIFSDQDSKASRYMRISRVWLETFVCFLPILIVFHLTGIWKVSSLYDWRSWYYTPGLWERTGIDFWNAFWFETPFAVARGLGAVIFLIFVLTYAYFGLVGLYWYYKEKK